MKDSVISCLLVAMSALLPASAAAPAETFELAAPGKEFQVYSHNHFRRRK